ncbi:MAG: hypothetical protein FWE56_03535, partial [Candidatus Bathyarchaeota archaeon]|nr:hypothetical protein [Candidatus Termiticorpusculum sp.]
RFLAEYLAKNPNKIPSAKCEKPDCIHLTEPLPSKYQCVHRKPKTTPAIKAVHLAHCISCKLQEQKQLEKENLLLEQQKLLHDSLVGGETGSHVHVDSRIHFSSSLPSVDEPAPHPTTTQQQRPSIQAQPKPIFVKNVKPIFELEPVKDWSPVMQADGSVMCPYSGDYVYTAKNCKQCKQTSGTMHTACLQFKWEYQKRLKSNAPTLQPTINNRDTQLKEGTTF